MYDKYNVGMYLPSVFCCFISTGVFLNTWLSNTANLPYALTLRHGFMPVQRTREWNM